MPRYQLHYFNSIHQGADIRLERCKGLQLFTENTNNGKKVQILIEELKEAYGTECHIRLVDLETEEQKKDWFRVLNPGGTNPLTITFTTEQLLILCEYRKNPYSY